MLNFINSLNGLIMYLYTPFHTILIDFGIDLNQPWVNTITYDQIIFIIFASIIYFVMITITYKFIKSMFSLFGRDL